MKFGIFYEHQLPKPWEEHSEYQLIQNSLAQIELADQLGNEDIVRLSPEQLKAIMAQKEAERAAAGDD